MQSETKTCQNCKTTFHIDASDFAFYEKIKVPPPTWCPECRRCRRMQWMNFRAWYNRTLDDKPVLSIYAPEAPVQIVSVKKWWSDEWNAMDYGRDYDFSKSFFTQFAELYREVPRANMGVDLQSMNCDYCNDVGTSKNCYLSTTIIECEDVYYSTTGVYSKEIFDSLWMFKCELCYQCIDCERSRGCLFSQNIDSCLDSVFLFDCRNVSSCIGCVGLRNKQYYVFNKSYSKDQYFAFAEEHLKGGYAKLLKLQEQFEALKLAYPMRHAQIFHSVDCVGDNIHGGKNCHLCFDLSQNVENLKYVIYAGLGIKDSYDCYNAGSIVELLYEGLCVGSNGNRLFFSSNIFYDCNEVSYSDMCSGASNLFGCVGLKKKQYCVLNKQYTKEEYSTLVPKIIQQMNNLPYIDKKGRVYKYGEFFPAELSPFAHNETVAQEHFPLTKEQALKQGYAWREREEKKYNITVQSFELPDKIQDVSDAILNEIIGCEHAGTGQENCSKAFRIIAKELAFYRRMNLPLPRLCPNCRYRARFQKRNPFKLWPRGCQCAGAASASGLYHNIVTHPHHGSSPCPAIFQTSYAPDRPEIVYCEKCYNAEVI